MMMNRGLAVFALGLGVVGCSGGDEGSDGTDTMNDMQAEVDCSLETRADPYVANMAKTGMQGVTVTLANAEPAPPAMADNVWDFSVTDSTGAPVVGANITVQPFMPDHGHPSPRQSIVTEMGNGVYHVDPVNFSMRGYWEVRTQIQAGDVTDNVVFKVCIPG